MGRSSVKPETALAPADVVWEGMSYEEWAAQGRKLGKLIRGAQWLVAAWILHGEARYGERYAQAVAETGLATQTILNILAVARAFPDPSRRREALAFGHHEVVATMVPEAQDRWLDAAERGGWSVTRLRAEVRQGGGRPRAPKPEAFCRDLAQHAWRVRAGLLPHCSSCSCKESP